MIDPSIKDERGYSQVFQMTGSTPLRMKRRNDWLLAQARRVQAKRILEIGCGLGHAAAHFAKEVQSIEADIVAVDLSERFIQDARNAYQLPNLSFKVCDLDVVGRDDLGSFDFVYGNGILHHLIPNLEATLKKLRTFMNPGGGMAFIEPNFRNPYCSFIFGTSIGRRLAKLEPQEMAFTGPDLVATIRSAGWKNVEIETRDFLIPGVPSIIANAIIKVEPMLEATHLTRWSAQSHFVRASA